MIVAREPTADGGFIAVHDTGLLERFDAYGNSLGFESFGIQTPTGLPHGLAPLGTLPEEEPPPPPDWEGVPQPDFTVYDAAPQGQYGAYPLSSDSYPVSSDIFPPSSATNPYTSSSYETGGFGAAPPQGAAPVPVAPLPTPPANFGSGGGSVPRYATGQTHPAHGGAPLQPGGRFANQRGGWDNRQQVRVPGGATAGPFEVAAAPQTKPNYGNHGNRSYGSRGPGGGGGGGRSPIYNKLRAKGMQMASRARGYKPDKDEQADYRKQQREYRQQQRAYADGSYIYDQYKMRGFSKKMDPQQAEGLYYRPSMLLPKVAPGLDPYGGRYQQIADLPAAQLSMLAYGRKGKAREGPSQYVNNLAKFYRDVARTGDLPDYDRMVRNLATAKGRSPLGAQFKNQPLGVAADTYESFVSAIMGSSGLDPSVARARMQHANALIDRYGSRFLKKPAKKAPPINRWVGKRAEF